MINTNSPQRPPAQSTMPWPAVPSNLPHWNPNSKQFAQSIQFFGPTAVTQQWRYMQQKEQIGLKNDVAKRDAIIKEMAAEKEDFKKCIKAQQQIENKEMEKKMETLRIREEKLNEREKNFSEEMQIAIGHYRSDADSRVTQIQLQMLSKEKEISELKRMHQDELAKMGAFVGALQKECDEKQAKLEKLGEDLFSCFKKTMEQPRGTFKEGMMIIKRKQHQQTEIGGGMGMVISEDIEPTDAKKKRMAQQSK